MAATATMAAAAATGPDAGKKTISKAPAAPKAVKAPSLEKLTCRTGPNDEQVRLIAEAVKGRAMEFAFYSRLGTRVCSIHGRRGDGRAFSFLMFTSGGFGARSNSDGLSCTPFPSNTGAAPVEVMERETGLVVLEKSLEADSGGAGRFRGGLGMRLRIENPLADSVRLSIRMDRMDNGADGIHGGGDGGCSDLRLNGRREGILPKGESEMKPGDIITVVTPGGGGYGNPAERDPRQLADDLDAGYVVKGRDHGAR